MCGYRCAGLPRILTINEDPRTHQPRAPVTIVHETEVSALMDGGNNVGYYAVYKAMQLAIEKARKSRIAKAVSELIENVRNVPPLHADEPVRIPSERAFRERAQRRKTRIPGAVEVHRQLLELAGKA